MLSDWASTASGYSIKNAWPIFTQMRLVKSPMELRLLQHAIDISIEAHQRAWAAAGDAKWEYEVDAVMAYTFKLRNADNWGYPDIVGCGPNATTLHYVESQGPVKQGELLLMDVGAEYDHYTADITRTFPVNGKFTAASGRCLSDCLRRAGGSRKGFETRRDVVRCESCRNRSDQRRSFETRTDHGSQFNAASHVVYARDVALVGHECSRCWRRSEVCSGSCVYERTGNLHSSRCVGPDAVWLETGRLGKIQDCSPAGV